MESVDLEPEVGCRGCVHTPALELPTPRPVWDCDASRVFVAGGVERVAHVDH